MFASLGYRKARDRVVEAVLLACGLVAVFITLAFIGTPGFDLAAAIIGQWTVKVLYEAAATPGTYWLVNFLKRREGIDVYDAAFNPLPTND